MSAAADIRDEPAIEAELVNLDEECRRLEEVPGRAETAREQAVAKLAELDAEEAAVFLGEIGRDEHRTAREEAEAALAEASRAFPASEHAKAGLEERRAALEEELRLCRLASAQARLADLLPVRNEASGEFAKAVSTARIALKELERARNNVHAVKGEIAELGGPEELTLGPADSVDEPDWDLGDGRAAIAHDLGAAITWGPEQPTEDLKAKAEAEEYRRREKRRQDEKFINDAVRLGFSARSRPDLAEEVERRRACAS